MSNIYKQIPNDVLVNEFVGRLVNDYKKLEQEHKMMREALKDIEKQRNSSCQLKGCTCVFDTALITLNKLTKDER